MCQKHLQQDNQKNSDQTYINGKPSPRETLPEAAPLNKEKILEDLKDIPPLIDHESDNNHEDD